MTYKNFKLTLLIVIINFTNINKIKSSYLLPLNSIDILTPDITHQITKTISIIGIAALTAYIPIKLYLLHQEKHECTNTINTFTKQNLTTAQDIVSFFSSYANQSNLPPKFRAINFLLSKLSQIDERLDNLQSLTNIESIHPNLRTNDIALMNIQSLYDNPQHQYCMECPQLALPPLTDYLSLSLAQWQKIKNYFSQLKHSPLLPTFSKRLFYIWNPTYDADHTKIGGIKITLPYIYPPIFFKKATDLCLQLLILRLQYKQYLLEARKFKI